VDDRLIKASGYKGKWVVERRVSSTENEEEGKGGQEVAISCWQDIRRRQALVDTYAKALISIDPKGELPIQRLPRPTQKLIDLNTWVKSDSRHPNRNGACFTSMTPFGYFEALTVIRFFRRLSFSTESEPQPARSEIIKRSEKRKITAGLCRKCLRSAHDRADAKESG